jgi:sarcosine oxidase gamma subunit
VIDAAFSFAPARDVVAIDLWDGDLPPLSGRVMKVEPGRWWLLDGDIDTARTAIGDHGAVAAIGGGLVCATITGPGWRDLLSVSGFLDVESLRPGDVAATVIHHVAVRLLVTSDAACEVYCAASYAGTLAELWQRAAKGG